MSDFPIAPTMDRVYVKKDSMEQDKKNGLFLPQTVKGRAQTGTVIAIGPGYLDTVTGKFYPMQVKLGDRVFIAEFDGHIVRYEDLEFFIFSEKEILGIVKEERHETI
jgi:co-chaperonin GroES (HSP10)